MYSSMENEKWRMEIAEYEAKTISISQLPFFVLYFCIPIGEPFRMSSMTLAEAVTRCQIIFAHAWMVRTFVKHSETVEDFPELMQIVRTVFDTSRALEPKVSEPVEYLATLRKKIGKVRSAAEQFRKDAPVASDHENFRQAVISMDACVVELEDVLKMFPAPAPPAMPANFRSKPASGNLEHTSEQTTAE